MRNDLAMRTPHPDETDLASLLSALQASETSLAERQRCFHGIVLRFQNMAFATAYAALGEATAAEDAAQEAFLLAWERIGQVRDPAAFPGWFRRVVLSQCERIQRTRKRTVSLADGETGMAQSGDPLQAAERSALRQCLSQAIATLTEGERVAFLLHYGAEYTAPEIAAFLETTPGAVRQRLHQARQRLRERIPLALVQDLFQEQAPAQDSGFADRVVARLRPFSVRDWEAVAKIAHDTRPNDDYSVEAWLRYRQEFDESARFRRHFSAVQTGTEEVIGYGALEQQGDDPRYLRLFVCCTRPGPDAAGVTEMLYQRLVEEAKASGATKLWARQYADDLPTVAFLRERGFEETAVSVDMRQSVTDTPPAPPAPISGIVLMTVDALKRESPDDWASLLLTFINAIRGEFGLPEVTAEGVTRWFENPNFLLPLSYVVFTEMEPRRAIGVSVLARSRERPQGGDHEFFAIDPAFRDKGVAEVVLARHLSEAAANDIRTLAFIVSSFQSDLKAVFRDAGYAERFTYIRLEKPLLP
jgi:RNA polymerase sigma factor (sigma-70 family)